MTNDLQGGIHLYIRWDIFVSNKAAANFVVALSIL